MILSARRAGQRTRTWAFGAITVVFVCTTLVNIWERPDGVKIAACFSGAIVAVSLLSRIFRAFELRVTHIDAGPVAQRWIDEPSKRQIRLVANEPEARDTREYSDKLAQIIADNDMTDQHDVLIVEVTVSDASDFETALHARGEVLHHRYGHRRRTHVHVG